jgi:hypothetical protein
MDAVTNGTDPSWFAKPDGLLQPANRIPAAIKMGTNLGLIATPS